MNLLRKWEDLPDFMKCGEVKEYYDILDRKKISIFFKRLFDYIAGIILLVILFIPMMFIAIIVKLDSRGPVFYRQERITRYGKHFKIHKFRTMVVNADKIGTSVTSKNDNRITKIGKILRKYRLDELPQIFDLISGNMSLVGTRPEAVKYVKKYKQEYFATLLLPAGITSIASIKFKDEEKLLDKSCDIDQIYIKEVLPEKMRYNLESIKKFSLYKELKTIINTLIRVMIS